MGQVGSGGHVNGAGGAPVDTVNGAVGTGGQLVLWVPDYTCGPYIAI